MVCCMICNDTPIHELVVEVFALLGNPDSATYEHGHHSNSPMFANLWDAMMQSISQLSTISLSISGYLCLV